ncbi:MAG: hypothetical protein ACREMB_26470, partial [Candidatus Rokuibacteriota bacterium]
LPALAGLQPARELGSGDPASDHFKFTAATLLRERNRAVHALDEATELIDDVLGRKEFAP